MSSLNPLFLDSTKPVGDKLVTNVELICQDMAADVLFYLEFIDEHGSHQKIQLQKVVTKKKVKYSTDIWVKPENAIQCRWIQQSPEKGWLFTPWMSEHPTAHQIQKKIADLHFDKELVQKTKAKKNPSLSVKSSPSIKASALTSQLNFESLKFMVDEFNKK